MKQIKDYEPILSQIMLSIAKETRFRCRPGLASILAGNPRLVVAFNHGSPLSWLPAISLMCAHVSARGGGHRTPMGVMDRFFFAFPGLRKIAHQITQTERPLGFSEIFETFLGGGITDLIVFPEGSNCFFGNPEELQPFRSPKFVELSIRTKAPILICVHRGSEHWAKALKVTEGFLEKLDLLPKFAFDFLESRLKRTGLFALPLLPIPMEKFELLCELYVPTLKEEDLSSDPAEKMEQIKAEADLVHARMQALLTELDQSRVKGARQSELV